MSLDTLLDLESEFGQRVLRHLEKDPIIWFLTNGGDGTPQPRPVWYLWKDERFLIYSRPKTAKLAHILRQPKVALHFDGDGHGGDIVIFTGEAVLAPHHPPADMVEEYVKKYSNSFERIRMTPTQFAKDYSSAIVVTPISVRGH